MGSVKEVLEYLFDRLKNVNPVTHMVGDQPYAVKADGTLGAPVRELVPQFTKPTLEVSTLTGLVAAYKANLDVFSPEKVALHITGVRTVSLIALQADEFGHRHIYVTAGHKQECPFVFGNYYTPEDFLIAFRSSFFFNDNAVKIQRLTSTLTSENSVSVSDDGMSQVVTVKDGTVTRSAVELPPEIPLIPWRTFREANPVESKFMIRMKSVKDSLPMVALFEIDAKWRNDTIQSVAHYLKRELPNAIIIT